MDWTQAIVIIGSILIPTLGCFGWMISRMDKMKDSLSLDIRGIESRLSRIEGRFEERGYWESRRTGTQEKE